MSTSGAKFRLFGLSSRGLCATRTSLNFSDVVGFWFFCAADKRTKKLGFFTFNYLKCYEDSTIYLNFSGIPCDSVVSDIELHEYFGGISIFPNPSNGKITIQSELHESFSIEIFNNTGCLISESSSQGLNNTILDISSYPQGIYMIHIISDRGGIVAIRKLVKN